MPLEGVRCISTLYLNREAREEAVAPTAGGLVDYRPATSLFHEAYFVLEAEKTSFTLVSNERSLLVSVCSTNGASASNLALLKAQSMRSCSDAVRSTRACTSAS